MTELAIGIGCQRGTPAELLARGIDRALREVEGNVRILATIDRKRDELGILQLAQERGWTLVFYTAEELGEGVAEPAASKHGQLVMGKRVHREGDHSMTLAIAELSR